MPPDTQQHKTHTHKPHPGHVLTTRIYLTYAHASPKHPSPVFLTVHITAHLLGFPIGPLTTPSPTLTHLPPTTEERKTEFSKTDHKVHPSYM